MKQWISIFFCSLLCLATFASNRYQEEADRLFSLGNYEKAFRTYGDAIKADRTESNNYTLYLKTGDCAIILGFKQLGINYYGISTQKGCNIDELCTHILNMLCDKNNKECLGQILQTIINRNPNTNETLSFEIGKILSNLGKHDKAEVIFSRIVNEDSTENIAAKKALAETKIRLGESETAKALYEDILMKDKEDFDANSFLGNYYYLLAKKISEIDGGEQTEASACKKYYDTSLYYLRKAYSRHNSSFIQQTIKKIETRKKD